MFIPTEAARQIEPWVITGIAATAAALDLSTHRIPNWLTLPAIVLGVLVSALSMGWAGLALSLGGAGLALVTFGFLFYAGVMGGGDVKLLMAFGAWGGMRFSIETALLSVLVGGIMAAAVLIFRRRFVDLIKRLHYSFVTILVREMEFEPPKLDKRSKMPFGLAMAVAAIWLCFSDPFDRWGHWP